MFSATFPFCHRIILLLCPLLGSEWKKTNITYHFKNFSPDLTEAQIRDAVGRAFQLWADVTPLTFRETSDPKAADIVIRFATGVHGDGAFAAFDGPGKI